MTEKSCGTIPYTLINGTIHFLLIKAKDGFCGFPKGHMENNETEIETALRETKEETSLSEGFEDFDFLLLPYESAYNELTFDEAKNMLKLANDYLTK